MGTIGPPWSTLIVGFTIGLQVGSLATLAYVWWAFRRARRAGYSWRRRERGDQ